MTKVIFIPGIMGSTLKYNDSELWPAILPRSMEKLSLEIHPQILDAGPLLSFKGLKKFYQHIDDFLDQQFSGSYEFFAYDWRHNLLTIDTFERLLLKITDCDDVTLIAHSMGGLLVNLFIKWCQSEGHSQINNIKNIITLATPWRGSPEALWRLYYGEPHPSASIPLTSPMTMKKLVTTFPSIYQLFPHPQSIADNNLVFDPNLTRYLHSTEIINTMLDNKQITKYREITKDFSETLQRPWPSNINTYAVIAQGFATPTTIHLPTKDEKGHVLFKEQIMMGAGDKTVPVSYAMPYDASTNYRFIKETHQGIVNNQNVLQWILCIVNNEENLMIDKFEHEISNSFSGKVIKVACPVEVSVYKEGDTLISGEAKDLDELKQQLIYLTSLEDSTSEDELKVFGDTTYYFTEELEATNYKIEGKANGIASIEITDYTEGIISEIDVFSSIAIEEGVISTLVISSSDNISLYVNNNNVPLKPTKVKVDKIRSKVLPVTEVTYKLMRNDLIEINDDKIIQSPLTFYFNIKDIDRNDFLETRIIINGMTIVTTDNFYDFIPEPGPNSISIYSISKYGDVEKRPVIFNFIYDIEPPKTTYLMTLFPEKINVHFNASDDSKGKVVTRVSEHDENNNTFLDFFNYSNTKTLNYEYISKKISYYSVDQVGNNEHMKTLFLPDQEFKNKVFVEKFERIEQLIDFLGMENHEVMVISNGKQIPNKGKIKKNTSNIVVTTSNGDKYSFVFKQETDILWIAHPTELLIEDDDVPTIFSFKLITENGFVQQDNVSAKIVPKGKDSPTRFIELKFNQSTMEYEGLFGVNIVPRNCFEGKIQILINKKVYRESKFKIM